MLAQALDVVIGRHARRGSVRDHGEIVSRREPALVGVEDIEPREHISLEGLHADADLASEPERDAFPRVERRLVEGMHVVEHDEDRTARLLDDHR